MLPVFADLKKESVNPAGLNYDSLDDVAVFMSALVHIELEKADFFANIYNALMPVDVAGLAWIAAAH